MLGTYRRALALPGAWRFSATGLVARLPIAMVGLGIVLLVSDRTGSYAAAGVLSAAFQLPAALGAVATSRLIDRTGQSRLLPWLVVANSLLLVAFVLTVESGAPLPLQALVVAAAGLSQPAIGSMVRARWAHAAPDAARLRSAFALESIVDELIFTIGPPLTAVLAFQWALPAPLLVAALIGLVGGLGLAAQRSTQPPRADRSQHSVSGLRSSALLQPGAALVAVAALGIGAVFGAYEVSVVAFAQQSGSPQSAGLVLGVWAFGSMLGGLWFGARTWSVPWGRQMMLLPAVLVVALIPPVFVTTLPLLAFATAIGGAVVAPALITSFSLTERLVPAHQLTEGLTWTNSGLAVGFSAGTATAGFVVDAYGIAWGFSLAVLGAGFSAVVAVLGQGSFTRHAREHAPDVTASPWNDDPLPGPHPGAQPEGHV